jgi:hypothetical protein
MNMEEYIVYTRTGYTGWSSARAPVEFSVARRCDHDGDTVPKDRMVAAFPVGLYSQDKQRERANALAHALNVQAAAMPPLKLEVA